MMPDPAPINQILASQAPALWRCLSPLGRRLSFPKGIPAQADEARLTAFNATIGQVTDGAGNPVPLPSLASATEHLDPKVALLYSPQPGHAEVRERWLAWQLEQAGRTRASCTLPFATHGLTHSLAVLADLLVDADTTVLLPRPSWENYDLLFTLRTGAKVATWDFFHDDALNVNGFADALSRLDGKVVVLLNFPANPTGYSPTPTEADALIASIAARRAPTAVIVDDAYQGVVHRPGLVNHSLFWQLADVLDPEHAVVFKVDGATKELLFFPSRVGFITASTSGSAESALANKLNTLVRATAGSPPGPSQALMLELLREPERTRAEIATRRSQLTARWTVLHDALHSLNNPRLRPLPFNSAYFALIAVDRSVDAESVRRRLIADHDVGTITIPEVNALRVAFCSTRAEALPEMVARIDRAVAAS